MQMFRGQKREREDRDGPVSYARGRGHGRGYGRGRGRGGSRGRDRSSSASGRGRGEDFRWKKVKKVPSQSYPTVSSDALFLESGDALPEEHPHLSVRAMHSEAGLFPIPIPVEDARVKTEKRREIRARQLKAKRTRRLMHEQERQTCDLMLRTAPESLLWDKYVQWAGTKLSFVEKKVEKWNAAKVCAVVEDDSFKLIDQVKEAVGPDYVAQGEWRKKTSAVPGVACLVLGSSALRAVRLGTRVYDGKPVGKLFSKHIKIGEQKAWLKQCCKNGLTPTAVGTSKRIQRLIEEGDLTLKHTSALVIDCCRDGKDRNIFDFTSMSEELFEFLHAFCRERIAEEKMRIILYVPRKEEGSIDEEEGVLQNSKEQEMHEE